MQSAVRDERRAHKARQGQQQHKHGTVSGELLFHRTFVKIRCAIRSCYTVIWIRFRYNSVARSLPLLYQRKQAAFVIARIAVRGEARRSLARAFFSCLHQLTSQRVSFRAGFGGGGRSFPARLDHEAAARRLSAVARLPRRRSRVVRGHRQQSRCGANPTSTNRPVRQGTQICRLFDPRFTEAEEPWLRRCVCWLLPSTGSGCSATLYQWVEEDYKILSVRAK